MSDMDPAPTADAAKDGERSEEKRIRSAVAKALFRSAQGLQAGAEAGTLSREQRKENLAKAWKENRKVYLKEAKRVVRELNLTAANVQLRPRKKKAAAGTAE